MMKRVIPVLIFGFILAFGACKKDKDPSDPASNFDEKEILKNWTNNLIVPSYKLYNQRTTELISASKNYSTDPTISNLRILQEAHSTAYLAWQKVSIFDFGPAADVFIKSHTNTFPCDTSGVNTKISGNDFSLAAASDLDKKGFPALDFLLFAKPDSQVVNNKIYIQALCEDLSSRSNTVLLKWQEANGYSSEFIAATGTSAGSSISVMINAINEHLERYHREAKFAIPSGVRSFSKNPLPGNVEAVYEKTTSLTLAKFNLRMIQSAYLGLDEFKSDGVGLDDFLKNKGGEGINSEIETQLEVCISDYTKYNLALSDAVLNNKSKVAKTIDELQKLTFLLKADLPSKLGVLISYQDSDGD